MLRRMVLSVHSARAASEQHNEGREEQADHSNNKRPHSHREFRMAIGSVAVHMSLDDPKEHEISRHNDYGDDPGNC